MIRIKRLLAGGSAGNEQLTAVAAAILLLLLAIEGATLLQLGSLLTLHAFVGMLLLAVGQTSGTVVGLHKASFVVWFGATGVHVLAHALKLPALLRARVPGGAFRLSLVAATVVAGAFLATATLPQADRLQDRATGHIGVEAR
jgi:uncharacterized oligopeptide transporter (OPT) family protein